MEELKNVVSAPFKKNLAASLSEKDFEFSLAFDLKWFSPKTVSEVKARALEAGLLSLKDGVIIRSGAYIGHHCHIGAYSYVAPRASMSGHTVVGENVFIGNNATLRDRLTIGHEALIGAGAVVLRDVGAKQIWRGEEARLLYKDRDEVRP